jgi:tRNA modification GTPase
LVLWGFVLLDRDVIVGLATPAGAAGVAVVRLSGDGVLAVGGRLADCLGQEVGDRRLRLCRVWHPVSREFLDQAMVCFMAGPRSYTGEDVVELQTHGGTATVAAVMGACLEAGARMARPGEFTLRAFLNGRIDLAEAEAVAGLVGAQSDRARRVALRQLHGGLGDVLGKIRRICVEVLAEVEARLDFPDEELADLPVEPLAKQLDKVGERLDALVAQAPAGRLAREGARVVLLGRPNVGKSSLLNALVGRSRAIVHASPGTTRDWLEDELALGGLRLTIVDTAGQRPGTEDDPAESMGALTAMDQARHADLVLLVINLVEGMTPADQRLLDQLGEQKVGVVLNQTDLVEPETLQRVADQVAGRCLQVLGNTSAVTGDGVLALTEALRDRFDGGEVAFEELPLVSEQRHEESLRLARALVSDAGLGLRSAQSEELVALDLREATRALGSITGEGVTQDVLEQIFSRFCIGK